MGHKPCGLVGDAEHAVELVRGHALLRGREKVSRQEPLGQGDLRPLEDGADRDREGLPAIAALQEARAGGLAREAVGVLRAAVRADGTIGPADLLKVLAGLVLVVVDRVGQVAHGRLSLDSWGHCAT